MNQSEARISAKTDKAIRHEHVAVEIPATIWDKIQRGAKKRGLNEEQFITFLLSYFEPPKPLTASEVIHLPKKERERVLKAAVNRITSDYADEEVIIDTQELVEY